MSHTEFAQALAVLGVAMIISGLIRSVIERRRLRRISAASLNTPASQEALAELNETQKAPQTPPTDR